MHNCVIQCIDRRELRKTHLKLTVLIINLKRFNNKKVEVQTQEEIYLYHEVQFHKMDLNISIYVFSEISFTLFMLTDKQIIISLKILERYYL